jgi:hypothetical protein
MPKLYFFFIVTGRIPDDRWVWDFWGFFYFWRISDLALFIDRSFISNESSIYWLSSLA